jgi:hypothetical protein
MGAHLDQLSHVGRQRRLAERGTAYPARDLTSAAAKNSGAKKYVVRTTSKPGLLRQRPRLPRGVALL